MVIARLMAAKGYFTEVYIFGAEEKFTSNSKTNIIGCYRTRLFYLILSQKMILFLNFSKDPDIIIDALIGSGLSKPVKGFLSKVISHLNASESLTISIDIPSGLFSDETMAGHPKPSAVHADHTLTFAPLKLAFLFPENDLYAGNWHLLDIGISREFIDQTETRNYYLLNEDVRPLLKSRNLYAHKGHFGHALLVCGSTGKMGAAILSSRSCLRAGAGLVSVHIPREGNSILQTAVPEAMVIWMVRKMFFLQLEI